MKGAVVLIAALAACVVPSVAAQRIKLAASLADLEKAARKDSGDAAAHYNVALAYWNAKRWDDADSALHRAIRLEPRFAAAYMGLAALPYARRPQLFDEEFDNRVPTELRRTVEESERRYRQAVLIDPLVEVRIGYVMLPPSTSNFQTSLAVMFGDWFDDYVEGRQLYFQGEYQESYIRFQRVYNELDAEHHPSRLFNTLLFWHGLAAAQVGKYDDAVWDFATILTRLENTEAAAKDSTLRLPLRTNEFRYILGVMKQRAGKPNEAIDLYRQALQNDIGLYMAQVRLAQIYEEHNMLPQAVVQRRAAINTNPDDASLLLDLGKTLARANQWIDAEQALQQAVAANPRDPRPYYFLGIVQQHQNKTAEARAAFTDFVTRAPTRFGPQVADAKQRLNALQ
ncbi:MAG: tetratricopeptide repeat protein [Gemmatimonadales bacterium]